MPHDQSSKFSLQAGQEPDVRPTGSGGGRVPGGEIHTQHVIPGPIPGSGQNAFIYGLPLFSPRDTAQEFQHAMNFMGSNTLTFPAANSNSPIPLFSIDVDNAMEASSYDTSPRSQIEYEQSSPHESGESHTNADTPMTTVSPPSELFADPNDSSNAQPHNESAILMHYAESVQPGSAFDCGSASPPTLQHQSDSTDFKPSSAEVARQPTGAHYQQHALPHENSSQLAGDSYHVQDPCSWNVGSISNSEVSNWDSTRNPHSQREIKSDLSQTLVDSSLQYADALQHHDPGFGTLQSTANAAQYSGIAAMSTFNHMYRPYMLEDMGLRRPLYCGQQLQMGHAWNPAASAYTSSDNSPVEIDEHCRMGFKQQHRTMQRSRMQRRCGTSLATQDNTNAFFPFWPGFGQDPGSEMICEETASSGPRASQSVTITPAYVRTLQQYNARSDQGRLPENPTEEQCRAFLLIAKEDAKMQYREIKDRMRFPGSESTLRGRYRTLTKEPWERRRQPQWSDRDIALLRQGVLLHRIEKKKPRGADGRWEMPWKKVAKYIKDNGGSQRFGNGTIAKMYRHLKRRNRWDLDDESSDLDNYEDAETAMKSREQACKSQNSQDRPSDHQRGSTQPRGHSQEQGVIHGHPSGQDCKLGLCYRSSPEDSIGHSHDHNPMHDSSEPRQHNEAFIPYQTRQNFESGRGGQPTLSPEFGQHHLPGLQDLFNPISGRTTNSEMMATALGDQGFLTNARHGLEPNPDGFDFDPSILSGELGL